VTATPSSCSTSAVIARSRSRVAFDDETFTAFARVPHPASRSPG
jgi:hypothetical protein